MSISLLRQLLMKEAVKKSAGSSGITTINKNIAKDVDKLLQKYINDALQQGVDLDTLSPEQLKMIVAMNRPKPPKVFSGQEAMDQLNKLFPKKGEVVDMTGKKLDTGKPIIGGTQDDSASGIMGQIDDRMKNINKANDRLTELLKEREILYGKAPKTEKNPKVIEREMFKEANEKFNKPKTEAEIKTKLEKENKENVAKINKRTMEEDREIENLYGSAGFGNDQKIDAEFLAEYLAENAGKVYDDLLPKEKISFYGRAYDALTRYKKNVGRSVIDEPQKGPGTPEFDGVNKDPEYATGGRAGYYTGGITDVEPKLDDIGHGSDSLMSRTRLMSPGSQATTSTGLNYLLAEDNDNIRVPFEDGGDFKQFQKEKMMQLMQEYQQYLKNREIEKRQKPYMEKRMGTGPGPILEAAEGGRIGFKVGGDAGRRAFLKLLAALGGGAAAFKTGLLSLGGKGATKKAVTETIKQSAGSGQPPPYFFKLVDKIRTLGDDTLATQDKAIAKKYKDYVMEEDFAGNIEIIKKGEDLAGNKLEDVYMKYTIDEVPLRTKKGSSKVEEYEEFTARPDMEGKMKDVEPGVPEEVIEEAGDIDAMTLKKAEGGRIGFSAGGGLANVLARLGIKGSSRRFLEKAFGKERFEEMIKNDPDMHRGLLEVVEMFRNRDKEGLKMYMQKFLPHMDDATVEEFIVGSRPDIEGLTGQLTRLGSGRDYAQKIEMMKKADQVKKLQNFDIKNVSENAEGGRIGKWMGGPLTWGKGQLRELLKYMAKNSTHGKTPSEMLQMVNPKQFNKMLNDPATMGKVTAEAPEGIAGLIKEYTSKMKTDRANMVGDLIGTGRKIKKVDDDIVTYKIKIVEDMVSKGMDRKMAEEMAETMAQMVSQQARKKATPKITDQGLLEMENIQKNLLTKDRKLQAEGGLTTMLGE